MKDQNVQFGLALGVKGRVKVQVVSGPRECANLVRDLPWQDNLILDSGLDMFAADVATSGLPACTIYAAAGYGTSVANVAQTQLDNERGGAGDVVLPVRTNTYLTGAGNCGTTHVAGTGLFEMRRTYDFSDQITPAAYGEVGFSNSPTRNATLFSRIKLGGSVGVAAAQRLRVIYDLSLTVSPVVSTGYTPTITGWASTDGDHTLNRAYLDTVNTSGTTVNFDAGSGVLNPGASGFGWMSDDATALTAFEFTPTPVRASLGDVVLSIAAYTPGTFYREKSWIYQPTDANSAAIRSLGLGGNIGPSSTNCGYTFLFDSVQTKDNMHRLTLVFRTTVNRV